jgi:ATP-dependent Clp protease ATP-binding subunit ClpA
MYERFTDRARKVMQLANQEARRHNHEYIGTEHILLGLVQEGSGVAANVLKNLDIDLHKIRPEVEKIIPPGFPVGATGKLPQTPRAKKVIEYSIEEARNLNHNYVGTEHLLLGLLREQEGVGAQVLMNLGVSLEATRREVLNLLGQPAPPRPVPQPAEEQVVLVLKKHYLTLQKWNQGQPAEEQVVGPADLNLRLQALESQLRNVRVLLGVLAGTLVGGILGGEAGAVAGLALGTFVGLVGGRVLGGAVGAVPGALLATTYLHGDGWAPVGLVVGAVLGAFLGDLGRPTRPGQR